MSMLLKACPRCEGDLHLERDWYGTYAKCIQCGHTRDLPEAPAHVAAGRTGRETPAGKEAA